MMFTENTQKVALNLKQLFNTYSYVYENNN